MYNFVVCVHTWVCMFMRMCVTTELITSLYHTSGSDISVRNNLKLVCMYTLAWNYNRTNVNKNLPPYYTVFYRA